MLRRLLLLAAVLAEVAATLSLKAALDEPAWYVLVVTGYLAAFTLLAAVLRRGTPVGVAYGVWAALGVMLTALAAAVVYGERLGPAVLAGIVLVVAGVLCVELGSRRPARETEEAA
ncbi:SMR family transporter [Kocuria sp. CPCC 205258]|uniref:multidrug efflux SMR transporter n=1 Tax=Kocuria sp. CPCC 205258 TaxID=3073552 RepID=UPI0034D5F9C8